MSCNSNPKMMVIEMKGPAPRISGVKSCGSGNNSSWDNGSNAPFHLIKYGNQKIQNPATPYLAMDNTWNLQRKYQL